MLNILFNPISLLIFLFLLILSNIFYNNKVFYRGNRYGDEESKISYRKKIIQFHFSTT